MTSHNVLNGPSCRKEARRCGQNNNTVQHAQLVERRCSRSIDAGDIRKDGCCSGEVKIRRENDDQGAICSRECEKTADADYQDACHTLGNNAIREDTCQTACCPNNESRVTKEKRSIACCDGRSLVAGVHYCSHTDNSQPHA